MHYLQEDSIDLGQIKIMSTISCFGVLNRDEIAPELDQRMKDLLEDVKFGFGQRSNAESLLSLSKDLQAELKQHLISSAQNMLPSFNYTLPTGDEEGLFLGVEVGGSNLWMALVHLRGKRRRPDSLQVDHQMVFTVDDEVKTLKEYAFFDWLVDKIKCMLRKAGMNPEKIDGPLRMGVAWSFPIEQTSIRSGNVLGMGKGYYFSDLVKGHDLGHIIAQACERGNLNVRLDAVVNDCSATLLSRAYLDPTTRLAVILGTGINAAIHLPAASLGQTKLAGRPNINCISHVLTNTEFSMYGKNIFPTTRWDDDLNNHHRLPDYQFFEYLVAGRYMSEIVRLIIVDATRTAGLFDGHIPPLLATPYAAELSTKVLAEMETDTLCKVRTRLGSFWERNPPHSYEITRADAYFVQQAVRHVSSRSIAYVSAGVHALASLLRELENNAGSSVDDLDRISIGCDGSVINRYPEYMEKAQKIIDQMTSMQAGKEKRILLEKTSDSAVTGAAIAAALAGSPEDEEEN